MYFECILCASRENSESNKLRLEVEAICSLSPTFVITSLQEEEKILKSSLQW